MAVKRDRGAWRQYGIFILHMGYFRRELDALEIGFPTTEKVYHAQQLYRILEDLAAEGYHQLNELLETEKCGSSRLQAYLNRNNAAPFSVPHPGPDEKELSYAEREVELAAAIRDAIKSASDRESGERTPFLRELKDFCRWIRYEPDTAYIFFCCGIPCCRLPTIRLGKEGAFIRGC